jgi:hypothetical protein
MWLNNNRKKEKNYLDTTITASKQISSIERECTSNFIERNCVKTFPGFLTPHLSIDFYTKVNFHLETTVKKEREIEREK